MARGLAKIFRRVSSYRSLHSARFGNFRPLSASYGFDRGTPVDRLYIEEFLKLHSDDVRGRVLEIGDDF